MIELKTKKENKIAIEFSKEELASIIDLMCVYFDEYGGTSNQGSDEWNEKERILGDLFIIQQRQK